MGIKFTWRPEKAKRNLKKHGVSFETAKEVFSDPHVVITEDCETDSETRYHAIGFAGGEILLLVVYVDNSNDEQEILHIVSARKADIYEQTTYADQFA
jgi:uncharacterized DUF497 family protein